MSQIRSRKPASGEAEAGPGGWGGAGSINLNCLEMPVKFLVPLSAAALIAAAPAHAQFTYDTIEDAARITEAHSTKLDRDSAQRHGDMIRFDVRLG